MILLDKDSCGLLIYLLALDHPETVMTISKALNQSRRKIYYQLEKINESLPEGVPLITSQPRVGIKLTEAQRQSCQDLLVNIDDSSYVLSMRERMDLMLVYIAVSPRRITIEKMMYLTDVSRNTVLNDLNEIRNLLDSNVYPISLYATKSEGYYLKGLPFDKVQYIHSLLHQILTEETEGFLSILESKISQTVGTGMLLTPDFRQFVLRCLKELYKQWGKRININEIELMVRLFPYLILARRNMEIDVATEQSRLKDFAPIKERIEFSVSKILAKNISEEFNVSLDEIEIYLLTILLLSYRKDDDHHVNSDDFQDMMLVLERFVTEIESHSTFVFVDRNTLCQRLLIHCKSLVYRKKFGMFLRNPLTQQIKEKYGALYKITQLSSTILEHAWNIRLNEDDIAYLTVHLGGAAQNSQMELLTQKICIVCDEGLAIQRLLTNQINHYFPLHKVEAVFTSEQFKSVQDIIKVDVIVQTSDIVESDIVTTTVDPILRQDDVVRLAHVLKQEAIVDYLMSFDYQLEHLLTQYLKKKTDREDFKKKLYQLLANEFHQGSRI